MIPSAKRFPWTLCLILTAVYVLAIAPAHTSSSPAVTTQPRPAACSHAALTTPLTAAAGPQTVEPSEITAPAKRAAASQKTATAKSEEPPAKKPLTVDDYAKWRSINDPMISADGKWVAYVLQLTNTIAAEAKPVLHIRNLETDVEVTVDDAFDPVFSADSKWIAYQVDPGAAQRARAARGGSGSAPADQPSTTPPAPPSTPPATPPTTPPATPPSTQPSQTGTPSSQTDEPGRSGAPSAIPPRRAELRSLKTGAVKSWQDIGTIAFSPASTHLVLRRRPPEKTEESSGRTGGSTPPPSAAGRRGSRRSAEQVGLDVLLVDLKSGNHQLLGSVGEFAFNRTGKLLAFTVHAEVKDANGVFLFDSRTGRTIPLDNDAKIYSRLSWNDEGTSLAALKGSEVEKKREKDNVLLAFPDIEAALKKGSAPPPPVTFEPSKTEGFPQGWVVSDRSPLNWSEDGRRVFFGIKEQLPAPDTKRKSRDEQADVDIWNTDDERIQSAQMVRAERDRNFTFGQAYDVAAKTYIKLADETMRELDTAPDGKWAVGMDTRGYIHDHKFPAADIYRVDTATGERTLIAKGQLIGRHAFGINPHGTHFLYWKDEKIQAYAFASGTTTTLDPGDTVSFVNLQYDHPGSKPSYGIAGYSSDGKAVIAQQRYDLWLVPLDGSAPKNLTTGAGTRNEIRFRLLRPVPDDPTVPRRVGPRGTFDLTKPLVLSAYGEWTKKTGYYELAGGRLKELVYEDALYSPPVRALKTDRFLFTRQTFVEFPDLRVSGPDFKDSKKICNANPQQKDYLWGHRRLFDFQNKDGVRLQGILAIPDDYKPGEKRPLLVMFYEKNSQNMHRYTAPAFLPSMGRMPVQAVSDGYITMLPDIHFRTGSSHSDMLECVEAATRKVIEMGIVDPKRIGVSGHSYSGEGSAYIGTMSKMFAAVGMGAGVVDLYNDFSQNWGWAYQYSGGSGNNGSQYYLYGQGRWGFSPWDEPDRYRDESALTHAPNVSAPFLIMHGTADPTVDFSHAVAFYNALRYLGKKAVLLAYPNEGHGLRGLANKKDLTVRFFEFFDHYLKDAPAPKWLTEGVPYLKKEAAAASKQNSRRQE